MSKVELIGLRVVRINKYPKRVETGEKEGHDLIATSAKP